MRKRKNLERFVQVGYDALDTGDGGITGEANPVRHREIAKKLAPAFSMRNLKAKEATIHKYIDLFIDRMKEVGSRKQGVEMQRWTDWLALDLSADMTYGREMGQMRDGELTNPRPSPKSSDIVRSKGLGSSPVYTEAQLVRNDEPDREKVSIIQPIDLLNHSTICMVRHANTY